MIFWVTRKHFQSAGLVQMPYWSPYGNYADVAFVCSIVCIVLLYEVKCKFFEFERCTIQLLAIK